MKKLLFAFSVVASAFVLTACDENLNELLNQTPLTRQEVASGLKQALEVGTDTSVAQLNVKDGFYSDLAVKIFLPPEAQKAVNDLKTNSPTIYGLVEDNVEDVVLGINRAAEDAAGRATPIFVNAITSMTIEDAFGILQGSDSSATVYLRGRTYTNLTNEFKPTINTSLSIKLVANQSPNQLWNTFKDVYNGATLFYPNRQAINDDLPTFVTTRALDGLFKKIANEEKLIREDPIHRVTDLLKRVFGSQN